MIFKAEIRHRVKVVDYGMVTVVDVIHVVADDFIKAFHVAETYFKDGGQVMSLARTDLV